MHTTLSMGTETSDTTTHNIPQCEQPTSSPLRSLRYVQDYSIIHSTNPSPRRRDSPSITRQSLTSPPPVPRSSLTSPSSSLLLARLSGLLPQGSSRLRYASRKLFCLDDLRSLLPLLPHRARRSQKRRSCSAQCVVRRSCGHTCSPSLLTRPEAVMAPHDPGSNPISRNHESGYVTDSSLGWVLSCGFRIRLEAIPVHVEPCFGIRS